MLHLTLIPNGDGTFADLKGKKLHEVRGGIRIAGLAAGMDSGFPSVAIVIDLGDGSAVFAETSLKLFLAAADALKAVHGDPRFATAPPGKDA